MSCFSHMTRLLLPSLHGPASLVSFLPSEFWDHSQTFSTAPP